MHGPFIINVLIVLVIITGLVLTQNPLFILGCFFFANMPFVVPEPEEDYPAQPMGFTADVE